MLRIPILAYHSILHDNVLRAPSGWNPNDTISQAVLRAQLDLFKAERRQSLLAKQLNDSEAWKSPAQVILFTFDDAHDSDLLAAAELAAREFTATFFIPWSNLGRANFLDRHEVRQLYNEGFEIGSHGLTHSRLTEMAEPRLTKELSESKARLEDLIGASITALAVPFGRYNQRIIRGACTAGYKTIMTSDVSLAETAPRSSFYPRLPVKSLMTVEDVRALVRGNRLAIWRQRFYGRILRFIQGPLNAVQSSSSSICCDR